MDAFRKIYNIAKLYNYTKILQDNCLPHLEKGYVSFLNHLMSVIIFFTFYLSPTQPDGTKLVGIFHRREDLDLYKWKLLCSMFI